MTGCGCPSKTIARPALLFLPKRWNWIATLWRFYHLRTGKWAIYCSLMINAYLRWWFPMAMLVYWRLDDRSHHRQSMIRNHLDDSTLHNKFTFPLFGHSYASQRKYRFPHFLQMWQMMLFQNFTGLGAKNSQFSSRRSVGSPMKVCGARTLGFMILVGHKWRTQFECQTTG